jgi:hypothetical protein
MREAATAGRRLTASSRRGLRTFKIEQGERG